MAGIQFKDAVFWIALKKIFEKHKVRYLVVGGYAVMNLVFLWKILLLKTSPKKVIFIRWEGHL